METTRILTRGRRPPSATKSFSRYGSTRALGSALALVFALVGTSEGQGGRFCSQTARAQFDACGAEVRDDGFVKKAICINISDAEEREECFTELVEARQEGNEECRAQHEARRELCAVLGEGRYDPDFDPANFDADFTNLTNPNLYFPLTIGNVWEYVEGDETVRIEVLNKTKLIAGVTCLVVNDLVAEDGKAVEDTDDWFAQRKNGDVYYCGEEVKDFETFAGDNPQEPELVSIDGSFKAGRNGDKPGIQFLASPQVGDIYRQEFSVNNAEDVAEVISTTYGFGSNPELDQAVPQALANLLCANNCVVTREFSPTEPGSFARKYYAQGIGFFLETKPQSGKVGARLVNCNFDVRCASLPQP